MRPGKEVSYSADLIPRLLSDHRHLFEAFDEAERASARRFTPWWQRSSISCKACCATT